MSLCLDGARVMVFGGTGSLGGPLVRRLLDLKPRALIVFSRDEKKQVDMRRCYCNHPELGFVIGDVRDRSRVHEALRGVDIAINAAALKQVPICEEAPTEALLTNVIGVINIRQEALAAGVDTVLSISTDKAVKPVNVMGMTKAIGERVLLTPTPIGCTTRFLCVRYGNVLGSRGSVVPLFCKCVAEGRPLPITDTSMTRFIVTLDEAVDSILAAISGGQSGEVWVRHSPAVRIVDLGQAIAFGLLNGRSYPMTEVGIRAGEKVHEILVSAEEMRHTRVDGKHLRIRADYANSDRRVGFTEYTSRTERKLSESQILALLRAEGWLSPGSLPATDQIALA